MATKFQLINEAYENELANISNPHRWQEFLTSACRNYKCRFDEQVLIFAQRPDATAVLEIDKWNRQFNRWVNKGATGIAVLDKTSQNQRLKYYFDITDTHESRNAKTVPIWQMNSSFDSDIIDTLESTFGELNNKDTLIDAIFSASENAATDNLTDYINDLKYYAKDSFLDGTGDDYITTSYRDLVKNSVAFMIMERLGLNTREYFSNEDFVAISDFNTKDTVNALGIATSDIAEMGLKEIATTVITLQKNNKNQIRTFVDNPNQEYNISINKAERNFDNEQSNLHTSGRLQPTEPHTTRGTGSSPWEVRIGSQEISRNQSQGDVHQSVDIMQTERTLDGNRKSSLRNDGNVSFSDGEKAERDRTTESHRPNEMGWDYEQYQELSSRNSDEGANLQLNADLPTEKEQQNIIEESEVLTTSDFSILQEDIDDVLTRGSGVQDGKYRIFEQYLKNQSLESNILFLKKEYGTGGASPAIREKNISEIHDAKGIELTIGTLLSPKAQITVPWNKVALRIGELIKINSYLNEKEHQYYPLYLEKEAENKKYMEIGSEFSSIIREYNDYLVSLGEEDKKLNQYVLSDCGSCFGRQENKTHMATRKGDYILPLMQKAMNDIIAENTSFTSRATAMLEILNSDMTIPLLPEPEPDYEYNYHLGDTVYIGAKKYEILSFDNNTVSLYDESFPLFNKEMERTDFDAKVQENPSNDHLRVIVDDNNEFVSTEKEDNFIEIQDKTPIVEIQNSNDDLIGQKLTIDNREYLIEDIRSYGDVEMRDITFENAIGFPINRLENAEYIRRLLAEKQTKVVEPNFEKKPKSAVKTFDIHPEIKQSDRSQYVITDDNLGVGSAKEKFRSNMNAIKLLKQLEFDNRLATPSEQETLAGYVGFGSLADAFDENKSAWANEFNELYETLSPEEYTNARESTLTAFYTSPTIIRNIYKALENMGFSKGNILEPSCGIGNFIGMLPDSMKESKIYGVEIDSLTGRIAQQLYQKSSIAVQGYESTNLPDSFFDAAIGNVPFGQFKVDDKKYNKNNWLIHDYFFGKTLDKVRPGGVVAFITSKGTLDKENPAVRKYLAQRADLICAIRLPNNAFKANAGTEVTSDIIFLQKRDRIIDIEPDWVHLGKDENGLTMNQYFVDNPHMIMGEMREVSGPFGPETACIASNEQSLDDQLSDAIGNIHAVIDDYEQDELNDEEDLSIPADPNIRNFSYALFNGTIYYRENSRMNPVDVSKTAENRIKGMIEIRDAVRSLIEYQTEDYPESYITQSQKELNALYDNFTKKYGLLSSRANSMAFSNDSSYALLSSLEIVDEHGNLERKADMFTKRTIKPHITVTSVDTASEALAVSLGEKARVDMEYMAELTGKDIDTLATELDGVIFKIPTQQNSNGERLTIYQTADEYLSGNVREKLSFAIYAVNSDPSFQTNVKALEKVQPVDLTASEIAVRLGATWLPTNDVREFIFHLLDTPRYTQWNVKVHFSQLTSEWNIEGKSSDRGNVKAYNTYGTSRINAYKIIEETLNLKDVRIFDYVEDAEGKRTAVLNKKETAIAQAKQELIKNAFGDWIWQDPQRRERLTRMYNDKFNSVRPREYDGSHLTFVGMNPEITLRKHQINAIAHIIHGGNTLLAHVVGAGKTFEMVAAAKELKRLGLCNKSLFVVPNHLTEQWASEFLQLYPSANILVATKKDFEPKNRKKFTARIATGDYDAIIIGHSQFEKIPMSIERQRAILEQQKAEILDGIAETKRNRGDNFTVKQLVKTQKGIEAKLAKLNDQSRKDDVVTFEELGVDRIFIDESHNYKNLYLYTKMRNVGGIAQTEAQKSSDLFMKCRYLDELTDGKGTIFATGTPVYYKLKL